MPMHCPQNQLLRHLVGNSVNIPDLKQIAALKDFQESSTKKEPNEFWDYSVIIQNVLLIFLLCQTTGSN